MGDTHVCTLDSEGKAYCWGRNNYGQLGNGSTNDSNTPVAVDASGVLAGKILTQIQSGETSTCALDSNGKAYCWGRNNHGQLGNGNNINSNTPVAVDTSGVLAGKTLTQLAAGNFHLCALDSSGKAYCWGGGDYGALANGNTSDSNIPVAVDTSGALAGKTLTAISGGDAFSCFLDTAGLVYCASCRRASPGTSAGFLR